MPWMDKLYVKEKFSLRLVIKALRFLALCLILPWLHLDAFIYRKASKAKRHARVQFWSRLGLKFLGRKLVVNHGEYSENMTHTLIVCNHQGLTDPLPILCGVKSPMSFVSKIENRKILGIGAWGDTIDLIYFDRSSREGNVKMLRECTQAIKSGHNVLIFPEGTRSKSDSMNPFKAKAFGIVKMAQANILPISLSHAYDPFDTRIKQPITLTLHPLIPYHSIEGKSSDEISEMIYDIIKKDVHPTLI